MYDGTTYDDEFSSIFENISYYCLRNKFLITNTMINIMCFNKNIVSISLYNTTSAVIYIVQCEKAHDNNY